MWLQYGVFHLNFFWMWLDYKNDYKNVFLIGNIKHNSKTTPTRTKYFFPFFLRTFTFNNVLFCCSTLLQYISNFLLWPNTPFILQLWYILHFVKWNTCTCTSGLDKCIGRFRVSKYSLYTVLKVLPLWLCTTIVYVSTE